MSEKVMNAEDLQALIAVGESHLIEFKRSGTTHLGSEICAFANSLGGRILIGVNDSGLMHPLSKLNTLRSKVQSIARNLDPPIMVNCTEVEGVLVVTVPESRHKPHSSSGKFYLREGASCQQMNRDEIRDFFYREGLIYFDEKINDRYQWPKDFQSEAFASFLDQSQITPALPAEVILQNLGLLKQGKMSYAGSLLFCKQSSLFVPGASVNCCMFQGTTTTRVLDQKIYDANLVTDYRSAVNYLLAHLNTAYEIGVERKEQLEIPEGAMREALLNAMAHRDYRKPGDLQVRIFQDRVEIINPGGLVGGMTIEKLGTVSLPRNPLLFGMMHRMGLVEKIGSGLKRIADMCREQETPEPEIQADYDWFRIVFHRKTIGSEKSSEKSSEKTGALILARLSSAPSMTISQLSEALSLSTRAVEKQIAKLKKSGRLIRVGSRKDGYWNVKE